MSRAYPSPRIAVPVQHMAQAVGLSNYCHHNQQRADTRRIEIIFARHMRVIRAWLGSDPYYSDAVQS